MLTLEQARNNIDKVLMNVREPALTRPEHDLLRQSLNLLYESAKDKQDDRAEALGTDTNTTE